MLFKDTAEIKKYISINKNFNFATIQPYIAEAEEVVAEFLGEELYDSLLSEYDTELSAPMLALLPYVQRPIINISFLIYMSSVGAISVSDSGIFVERANNSDPAPQWQIIKLEGAMLAAGDKGIDKLLAFLEANAATYPTWVNTSAYTMLKENFIQNATEATKYININGSRRVFICLKQHINFVEEVIIKQLVSAAQFNELKDQFRQGNLTADNALLVDKLKPIIAIYALKSAIPQMRFSITESGIMVSSFGGLGYVFNKIQNAATAAEIKELMKDLEEKGLAYTDACKKFLWDNVAKFPLYAASEAYTLKADPGPRHVVENSATSKIFGV